MSVTLFLQNVRQFLHHWTVDIPFPSYAGGTYLFISTLIPSIDTVKSGLGIIMILLAGYPSIVLKWRQYRRDKKNYPE